jgi:hypothetical protein
MWVLVRGSVSVRTDGSRWFQIDGSDTWVPLLAAVEGGLATVMQVEREPVLAFRPDRSPVR